MHQHYLYFHIAENEVVIYIGQTSQVGRVFRNAPWRSQIKSIKIVVFSSRWDAIAAERAEILKHNPIYNVQKLDELSTLKLRNRKISSGELPDVFKVRAQPKQASRAMTKEEIIASFPNITLETFYNKKAPLVRQGSGEIGGIT